MQCTWWWRTMLAVVVWSQAASCTVDLQPVTRLAGWQAHGSWVFNAARSVAAGTATNRSEIRVLSSREGTWMLADVLTPPEDGHVSFRPGSVVLSSDGRLLAVAVTTTATVSQHNREQQQLRQQQKVTVGYVYKVVAQPAAPHAFSYQLAAHLTVPASEAGRGGSNNKNIHQQAANFILTSQLDMTADGQTILACWAHQSDHSASAGATTAHDARSTAQGAKVQLLSTTSSTGGAAVFHWTSFGKSTQAVQLMLPKGSTHFGRACRLDHSGRVALVADELGGAMVYRQQAHAARGTPAAYLAAGWLAGALAGDNYQVLSADISPCGHQAVLLVRGLRPSTWTTSRESYTALKVFAADSYGLWSEACNVHISNTRVEQVHPLCTTPKGLHNVLSGKVKQGTHVAHGINSTVVAPLPPSRSSATPELCSPVVIFAHPATLPMGAGQVKLSAYPGGVHVWASLAGRQLMYAVGLTEANNPHCPTSPMLSSMTVTTPQQLPAAAWTTPPAGCTHPASHTASCTRAGKLTISGDDVTYTAAE